MRELKYNTDEKSARKSDYEKTNKPCNQPTMIIDHHVNKDKQDFGGPKIKCSLSAELSFINVGHFATEILLKVLVKNPGQIRDAIEDKPINMLKTVVGCIGWPSCKRINGFLYIGIHPFNVGIGVMINVMFYFPIVRVASQYIQKNRLKYD
jgi:hypothetical protein